MLPFRDYHLLQILDIYSKDSRPLDAVLRIYLKTHKAIGSKDRQYIGEKIYFIIRNLSLIDHFIEHPITWEKRLLSLKDLPKKDLSMLPPHIQYSCPHWLYKKLSLSLSPSDLESFLKISSTEAPLTIRANLLKTSAQELRLELEKTYPVEPCKLSPTGLKFSKREPLTSHPLFKKGYFEIQDEASQLAAEKMSVKPGDHVLDYCAGAGGKSLALAPKLQGKGVLYLHDIRPQAILEAKKRCERAGIHNVQFFDPAHPLPSTLKGNMDWVLCDVPCSGTGTFRRNPDLKWKLKEQDLEKLQAEQRAIVQEALSYLKPGGNLLYATCSVLREENQDQIEYLVRTLPLVHLNSDLVLLPQAGGHDGFFASILQKNTH